MRLILVCVDFSDVTGRVIEKASAYIEQKYAAKWRSLCAGTLPIESR